MDISNIIFYVLAVCMALFSVLTVTTRSIVRAATYLLFVLFGTAGLYFLLGYTFLGAVQAMVYAGGIIVLYVFSILLTSGAKDSLSRFSKTKVGAAIVTSLAGLALVAFILFSHGFASQAVGTLNECTPSIDSIGTFMLSSDKNGYLLPFEAVSVLLLACIVASLIIARKR
jgi:NADH-quinone oxidoreductase subunit J